MRELSRYNKSNDLSQPAAKFKSTLPELTEEEAPNSVYSDESKASESTQSQPPTLKQQIQLLKKRLHDIGGSLKIFKRWKDQMTINKLQDAIKRQQRLNKRTAKKRGKPDVGVLNIKL